MRFTSCACTTGRHDDEKAATRSHALRSDAAIVAFHTGRHVVPVDQLGRGKALPEGWRVARMTGGSGTFKHPYIAVAPGCPTERHPTRGCRCGTAASYDAAVGRAIEAAA